MPTLSLLPVVLLAATALAATGSFGHNVVPYTPQVRKFHPPLFIPRMKQISPSRFTSTGLPQMSRRQIPRLPSATP